MIFNSVIFLFVFLPLFLLCYYLLPNNKLRNIWFLIASLLFYTWGDQEYVFLLLVVIIINYWIGNLIDTHTFHSKRLVRIGLIFNIGILIYFKYSGFLYDQICSLFSLNINSTSWTKPILPLGISFFLFQCVSYLFDVYRGKVTPAKSWLNLGCYISMFPQLIAGPIVRYAHIKKQLQSRKLDKDQIVFGIYLFIIGLSYKVLLADSLAQPADAIYNLPLNELNPNIARVGCLAYMYQIYFDFNGYSTMAVGLGLMLGFKLPHNFNFPYVATSLTDFWRRWHITLSTWFRDYVYIPLGGNRDGEIKTYRNLMLVFILCGLWHGAAWNFLIWGLFHGFFLLVERIGLFKFLHRLPNFIRVIYVWLTIFISWIIFRSSSFTQFKYIFKNVFSFSHSDSTLYHHYLEFVNTFIILVFLISVLLSTSLINKYLFNIKGKIQSLSTRSSFTSLPKLWLLSFSFVLFIMCFIFIINNSYTPFIYFKF